MTLHAAPPDPADDRAERQIVSLISLYPDFWHDVSHLSPSDFRNIEAAAAWAGITRSTEAGTPPDPAEYNDFHDLLYPVAPLAAVARELAGRIGRASYLRAALRHLEAAALAIRQDDPEKVRRLLSEPPTAHATNSTYATAGEIAGELWEELTDEGHDSLIKNTGMEAVDRTLGGFEAQTLTVLMARPGMGKTALMVQLSDLAYIRGNVVAVFSKEMSRRQWMRRLAARRAKVSVESIRERKLSEGARKEYGDELVSIMDRKTLFIDGSTPQSTADVMAVCDGIKRQNGRLDFVFADHLRLFSDRADNETHRMGEISWGFKRLAKELDTRVILAAQLNREVEKQGDKRPDLKDLRDSGEIEENADNVLALYRERYYDPKADMTAEIIARKVRDGERNRRGMCVFKEDCMSFEPMERNRL